MAKLYNNAGQRCKGKFIDQTMRWATGTLVAMFGFGVVVGLLVHNFRNIWFQMSMVGLGAVSFFTYRKISPALDKSLKEGAHWLRGGKGEAIVAWILQDDLSGDWHVFNNVMIRPNEDVDHVVVGPGGIWAISTKSHYGLVSASGDMLLYNNGKIDWGEQALRQGMDLKDRLGEKLGSPVKWVNCGLALPFAYVKLVNPVKHVTVMGKEDLVKVISAGKKELSNGEVGRIVGVLRGLGVGAGHHEGKEGPHAFRGGTSETNEEGGP